MSHQPPTTPSPLRGASSSPLSLHQTPPKFFIKAESPNSGIKPEADSYLASHARFSQVARSFLPGRPDLTSATSTSSPKPSFAPTCSSPLSARIKAEVSLVSPRVVKDEVGHSVTSTSTTSTTNSASPFGGPSHDQPIKPAHITHLTEKEYRARIQHIISTRASLAPAMTESLAITRQRTAAANRNNNRQLQAESHVEHNEVATALEVLPRVIASFELDRQVLLATGNATRGNNSLGLEEAEIEVLKRARVVLEKKHQRDCFK